MKNTPEVLKNRLSLAGIKKVAVIDDAFDDRNLVELVDNVDAFYAEVGLNGEWLAQLVSHGISCDDVDVFQSDGLLEMWRKRSHFVGGLAGAIKELFLNAEEKLLYPTQVAENLKKLGLDVECFDLPTAPRDEQETEIHFKDIQLVFLDYDLEGAEAIDLITSELRSHSIAKSLALRRGDTPFLVLFSSLDGVRDEAERFREQAYYLRGSFLFIRKVDAADFSILCQQLAPSCVWSRDIGHFQHFFITLRDRLREVSKDVEKEFLQLDIQDYAHFQHVALQKDGAPLGKYMVDLFGSVLSHEFRDGPKVQEAVSALDRLDLTTQHLPFVSQPTTPLERIYRAVLTEPGINIGPAEPHPRSCGQKIQRGSEKIDAPPLLMLGDIFANGIENLVYIVLNSACDLQYAIPGRKPDLDLSVIMLAGKLEALALPVSNASLGERMRWLRYKGADFRVLWETQTVKTVTLGEFNQWQHQNKYERIARLSLPHSLALKQAWLANLSRVGLPVSPPIHDAHDVEIFIPDLQKKCWKSAGKPLPQEAIVAAHPADTSEPVKFCLTITARDYLFKTLSELIGSINGARKDGAEKALSDSNIWWELVTKYIELNFKKERWLWKFNPKGTTMEPLQFLWNAEPMESDFNSLPHGAAIIVLRPNNLTIKKVVYVSRELAEDIIRKKAYEISQGRLASGEAGDSLTDWLKAEQEVRRQGLI